MTKLDKIKKFISDNRLDFTGSGSELNSDCCIISGYACYLEMNFDELKDAIGISNIGDVDELERVFDYANENNYGDWWKDSSAHDEYIFEDK